MKSILNISSDLTNQELVPKLPVLRFYFDNDFYFYDISGDIVRWSESIRREITREIMNGR